MNRPPPFRKPFKPRTARHVTELLDANDAFAPLRAAAAQAQVLERDVRAALPAYLQAHVTCGQMKDGSLVVMTAHNALAARLRHLEPALLGSLQARGWPLRALRIKVSPAAAPPQAGPKQATISAAAYASLVALTRDQPPSPLCDALTAMVARHAASFPER